MFMHNLTKQQEKAVQCQQDKDVHRVPGLLDLTISACLYIDISYPNYIASIQDHSEVCQLFKCNIVNNYVCAWEG